MAEFSLDTLAIEKSIDESLMITSNLLVAKVRENTPRDKKRLPKNTIDRKDGKKPFRSSHYKPVQINWHWSSGNSKHGKYNEVRPFTVLSHHLRQLPFLRALSSDFTT